MNEHYNVLEGNVFDILPTLHDKKFDLIISDGPYGITNFEWDKSIKNIGEYNGKLLELLSDYVVDGGSIYLFGPHNLLDFAQDWREKLTLQTRIIWYTCNKLSQGRKKWTTNYEVIAWFTKGELPTTFNLDSIRVPHKTSKDHQARVNNVPSVLGNSKYKAPYNSLGKNPGNVWIDINKLTYKSKELISRDLHTIQKPEKLIDRIILASSNENDHVLDLFSGTGSTLKSSIRLGRRCTSIEKNPSYVKELRNYINLS